MTRSRPRRSALGVVTTAIVATVLAATMSGAGALGQLDDAVTTSTSIVTDVVGAVVGQSSSTTTSPPSTSSSSTTSTTSSTTTTTSVTIAPVTTTTEAPAVVADEAAAGTAAVTTTTTMPPVVSDVVEPLPVVGSLVARDVPALATPPGPRSTLDVLELLRGAPPQLVARVLAPFPIAGPAHYTDDWGVFRHGPPAHSHEGTDIFAERGTPVLASGDGAVSGMTTTGRLGGTSLRLTTASGSFFYYAHLDRFAPGLTNGDRVETGDVIGFVGNTGNAAGTPPHVHFEIHPGGGAAVPPVPFLDRWLKEATAAARAIVLSPAVDAVLALQPARRASTPPRIATLPQGTQRLEMQSINPLPVSAFNPLPLLSVAAPLAALSFLAHRGKKRARRRVARRS